MSNNVDIQYMSQALELARQGRYSVSPNPMVGCLIVKDGQIIGQGYHQKAGEAHAEIHALKQAGQQAQGATLYVTLEPCCHYGKTPPCTNEIIAAGIKKIFIATLDSNPLVSGQGMKTLQAAGIEVEVGILEKEAQVCNEIFFHYIKTKRPFVIAKWAMSLDGKTITHPNDTRDISSAETQLAAHELRQQVDAILVGANTVIRDNPQLTVRHRTKIAKHPVRVILTSRGELPLHLKLFDPALPGKTLVATTDASDPVWQQSLIEKNVEVLVLPKNHKGQVDLTSLLNTLGQQNITSVLVEGGMTVHESFFAENLVNKVQIYLAPVIIGSLEKKKRFSKFNLSQQNSDVCFTASDEERVCSVE